MTLAQAIRDFFKATSGPVRIQDLYAEFPEAHEHSIRARVYDSLGKHFKRIDRGVYVAVQGAATCIVVQGDALEEVKKLDSESIDALITDPSYDWLNKFREKKTTSWKRMPYDLECRDIDLDLGRELYRVLREGAHAFVFVPAETGTTRPHINRMVAILEKSGFVFRKRFIWDKLSIGCGYSGRARHEGIIFMTRGAAKRKPCDLTIGDVISVRMIDHRNRLHPAEKPVGLLEQLVKFATKVGEVVLDIFGGSCVTGKAALKLGRNSICVEKNAAILERALAPIG
jgi:site-specific DNA-methyltransferase (adenine-specific)